MEPVLISLTEEKTFPLNSPSTFIGRDQWRVNIRLPGDAVADVHCELIRQKAGFRLINLSETGTLVNGESVTEADIGDGDELTIASHRLRLFCAVETAESPEETVHGKTELSIEDRWSALNMSTAVTESAKEPRQTPDGTVLQIAQTTSEIAAQTVVEPQFFVMLGGHETGPLPLHALQQLAQDHRITADTPVKTEDVSHWSTAAGLNIDIPPLPVPSEPPDTEPVTDNADAKSCEASSSTAQWMLARCTWVLLSPVFYISACVRAVSALSPRMLIGGTAVTIALSATLFFWYRGWTQTAVMGTLTLDGKPLSGVTVTLTGMGTGGGGRRVH
ncbi:MAG: FHA domain-containing protein [Planctomycetaceae bacterium]